MDALTIVASVVAVLAVLASLWFGRLIARHLRQAFFPDKPGARR